jgi:putative nucleotidyltransferase with HDIG domain
VLADHPEGEQIRRISLPIGEGVVGAIAQSGEAEIVHDMTADPRSMHVPDTTDEPEAMMFAPLEAKGERIGIMSLSRHGRERPFNGDDLELFKAVASQVAVAILNAHYYEETRRRLNILESLQRVSNTLREARTFDEALTIVMDETLDVLGTDSGLIRLYDPKNEQLIVRVSRGWFSQVQNLPISRNEGFAGRAIQTRAPYRIRDYARDELTPEKFKEYIPEGWSGAAIPILTEVQPLGVMLVAVPHPRQISDEELTLLRSVADMAGTALQRMRLHEEALRRVEQLQALQTVDKAITSTLDIHVMLGVLIQQASAQLGGDAMGILLYTPGLQMLEAAAGRGFQTRQYERTRFPVGESLAGRAIITRQPVILTDVEEESSGFVQVLKAEGFSSYLAAPLIAKGQVKGVMEVFYRAPFRPDADWLSLFEMLAGQAAIAIDNAQLFDDLQRANLKLSVAYDATIEGWSKTLEMRDKETEGHTQRVTHLTLQLAERLGIQAEMLPHVRRGCILHDIGKMAVPDSILLKPGPLTEEEWAVMHTHPTLAYEMLLPIEYLQPALDIPYCHHEKWDGTGYPRGLKGASIPLPARIFAVVDVWDALTSDRPYRKAWSRTEALKYIRDQAGRHFDPKVVEEFLKLIAGGDQG